jgi:hypothetical protein
MHAWARSRGTFRLFRAGGGVFSIRHLQDRTKTPHWRVIPSASLALLRRLSSGAEWETDPAIMEIDVDPVRRTSPRRHFAKSRTP